MRFLRAEKEIKERYRTVISQVALRTIHEILVSTPGSVIDLVTFYGYVSTKDPATGQPIRPLLLQVSAEREMFSTFLLSDLDPGACLKRLNALVSPAPIRLGTRTAHRGLRLPADSIQVRSRDGRHCRTRQPTRPPRNEPL